MSLYTRTAAPAALAFVATLLVGCASSADMPLKESCIEYVALTSTGPKTDHARVSEDVRAAAPRWHEAVSKPALKYQDTSDWLAAHPDHALDDDESAEIINSGSEAYARILDLCGSQSAPKY